MRNKNKYAMVAINSKQDVTGAEVVRRVLIQYTDYKDYTFYNTRFIEKDPYFYNKDSSHQYTFMDEGYTLNSTESGYEFVEPLNKLRPYHYNPKYAISINVDESILAPIFIITESDEEAINLFNNRKELR